MKTKCCLSRLAKKIVKWFNETQAKGKNFDYRFTGNESSGFLHYFMYLIGVVEPSTQPGTKRHFTYCMCLLFFVSPCKIVSYCLVVLKSQTQTWLSPRVIVGHYLPLIAFFFSHHPTVWHLSQIVPLEMKQKYGMGLALNSMEGRQAKQFHSPILAQHHLQK